MKERILRLCKRLDKFTFNDIRSIVDDLEESVLENIILTFVQEGKIVLKQDIYIYNKKQIAQKNHIFSRYPKRIVDIAIRCFCIAIPAYKASHIIEISENSTIKIYSYFRFLIYQRQINKLNFLYEKLPKAERNRMFYDTEYYFYIYDNEVFISEKILQKTCIKEYTKKEIQEFKKIYSYLTRFISHNTSKFDLSKKIAEGIWRRNKEFDDLYFDLKTNLLNFS